MTFDLDRIEDECQHGVTFGELAGLDPLAVLALVEVVKAAQKRVGAADNGTEDDCYDAMVELRAALGAFEAAPTRKPGQK